MKQTISVDVRFLLGLLGSILLAVGVFLPIVRFPILGSVNYLRTGDGEGAVVLVLAALSVLAVTKRVYRCLWLLSVTAFGALGLTSMSFRSWLSDIKDPLNTTEMAELGPFRGLAEGLNNIAINMIQIEWGWVVLVSGAVLLMVCAGMKEGEREEG